jgi:hypothetical protein
MKNPSQKAFTPSNKIVLGDSRVLPGLPAYNLKALINEAKAVESTWNPSGSHGASPVIRLLLDQSGLVYSITGEIYNDGQIAGHQGGNALDVAGPSIHAVGDMLKRFAPLFSCVAYSSTTAGATVFVWNGAVTDPATITGATAFLAGTTDHIHVASSRSRMISVMSTNTDIKLMLNSSSGTALDYTVGEHNDVTAPPYSNASSGAQIALIKSRTW